MTLSFRRSSNGCSSAIFELSMNLLNSRNIARWGNHLHKTTFFGLPGIWSFSYFQITVWGSWLNTVFNASNTSLGSVLTETKEPKVNTMTPNSLLLSNTSAKSSRKTIHVRIIKKSNNYNTTIMTSEFRTNSTIVS